MSLDSREVYRRALLLIGGVDQAAAVRAADLESQGWEAWLKTLAPRSFSAPFSKEHREFWTLYWRVLHKLKAGEDLSAEEGDIVLALARGYGKSTQAEMASIMHGCILGGGLVLYLSDTQTLAEEHLYSIKAILETPTFAYYYPAMSRPKLSSSGGGTAKYTQDTIICESGFAVTARGITANVRGGRVGVDRFSLVISDDIDSLTDSLLVIEKKKRILSRTVFPAMAKNGVTILAQNLITENSVASQIVNRKTDILSKRTVIGGGAIKAFKELELRQELMPDGRVEWQIERCVPTWEYFNLEDARSFLARNGKDAFLAEYQHEFLSKSGRVIPNYNEEAQVITWSQFRKVFGEPFIPRHWRAACGLDVGFSDGQKPHYSAWAFVAVSAMNSPLPGMHFVYRGRDFVHTAVEDQADVVLGELVRGVEIEGDNGGEMQFGIIRDWMMSHEATGPQMTLHKKGVPFRKSKNWKSDTGIAQWNYLSRADKSQPNPFKEDERGEDGNWVIGRPSVYYIVDDDQLVQPRDHKGLKLMREQIAGWEYVPTRLNDAGLTVEKPSKVNDDFCFVAGTLITTSRGEVPIEQIKVGDLALTRRGYHPVIEAGITKRKAEVLEVTLSNGQTLTGTGEHPIFIEGRGFIPLKCLKRGDIIVSVWQIIKTNLNPNESFSKESRSIATQKLNVSHTVSIFSRISRRLKRELNLSTSKFGKMLTATFRRVVKSTIKTGTLLITTSPIWSVWTNKNIEIYTIAPYHLNTLPNYKNLWLRDGKRRRSGIEAMRGGRGTEDTVKRRGVVVKPRIDCVKTVGRLINPVMQLNPSFALHCAGKGIEVVGTVPQSQSGVNGVTRSLRLSLWIRNIAHLCVEKLSNANFAAKTLLHTILPENTAVCVVRVRQKRLRRDVYNLSVANEPEYFANGILVHNCDVLKSLFEHFGQTPTPLTIREEFNALVARQNAANAVDVSPELPMTLERQQAMAFSRQMADAQMRGRFGDDYLEEMLLEEHPDIDDDDDDILDDEELASKPWWER